MDTFQPYLPFADRVDQAITSSDFSSVVTFLTTTPHSCKTDPSAVLRLLNNLARVNRAADIHHCFQALIKAGFRFDSLDYLDSLALLGQIGGGTGITQAEVLEQLIKNRVSIDSALIIKGLEGCF